MPPKKKGNDIKKGNDGNIDTIPIVKIETTNKTENNGNNDTLPIVKIDTTNRNKKGKIQNKNMLIATEEGQLPYMCIIS